MVQALHAMLLSDGTRCAFEAAYGAAKLQQLLQVALEANGKVSKEKQSCSCLQAGFEKRKVRELQRLSPEDQIRWQTAGSMCYAILISTTLSLNHRIVKSSDRHMRSVGILCMAHGAALISMQSLQE